MLGIFTICGNCYVYNSVMWFLLVIVLCISKKRIKWNRGLLSISPVYNLFHPRVVDGLDAGERMSKWWVEWMDAGDGCGWSFTRSESDPLPRLTPCLTPAPQHHLHDLSDEAPTMPQSPNSAPSKCSFHNSRLSGGGIGFHMLFAN